MDYEVLEWPDVQDQKSGAVNILENSFVIIAYIWNDISCFNIGIYIHYNCVFEFVCNTSDHTYCLFKLFDY